MSEHFIRFYKKLNLSEITSQLLIYGDLSGHCAHCQAMDIGLDKEKCPQCGCVFHFIAFRNPKSHFPKMHKLIETRNLKIIDYDDYKHATAASKAQDFLK
ncbi:MAG: hypothetical protein H6755_00740 [Candidatus Omnitrophica bacterium]|nr:hypothetical protein [Candidatus Omnitrophota bacterium]MCB9746915.1 hypothetical protein [Candidatus Omnitrophota bacterium]